MNMEQTLESLAHMRQSYERAELDESCVAADPNVQFKSWFDEAVQAGVFEANAMTLATVGPDGRPSTRVVLLKGADERGLVWFTNYQSRKGRELAANPWGALQFFWAPLERVVRVEGRVDQVSEAESDDYYRTRPLGSRIGAWASPQSEVLPSRAALESEWAQKQAELGENPPRPSHWGGYRLVPDRWEFWQGRQSRLHDRISYALLPDGGWQLTRLAP